MRIFDGASQKKSALTSKALFVLVALNLIFALGTFLEAFGNTATYVLNGASMQHSKEPQIGILDDGDGLLISPLTNETKLFTYFEGKNAGYKTHGDWGDVVCFRFNNSPDRTTHRLVCYVKFNFSSPYVTGDIPELGLYGINETIFVGYGHESMNVTVNFQYIYAGMVEKNNTVFEGYLTKGDNIHIVDQWPGYPPIRRSDIIGKGEGIDSDFRANNVLDYAVSAGALIGILAVYSVRSALHAEEKKINERRYALAVEVLYAVFAAMIIARILLLISRSGALDQAGKIYTAVSAVSFCILVILFAYGAVRILSSRTVIRKGRSDTDVFAAPLFFLALLAPLYLVLHVAYTNGFLPFGFSIIALLFVASTYQLRPEVFFSGASGAGMDKYATPWFFLLGANIVLLLFTMLLTVPPYVFLVIGWLSGNIYILLPFIVERRNRAPH